MKQKQKQRLKSDERKCAMLDAARGLFLAKGFAATSLDDVVAKSGGSLTTLYQLFGNKEGLWRELVLSHCERISEPMQDGAADQDHPDHQKGPPAVVLRDVAARLMALKLGPDVSAGIRIVMTEGSKFPELARLLYENGPMSGTKSVAAYLTKQVEAGTLEIPDVDLAAELFCSMASGDRHLWTACGINVDMSPEALNRHLDEVVRVFLAAYQKKS
ncbi:MAG: TetR/AcrR family transcriptional regulator [Rhodospirillaceae bacterium]|nr:TetR/AcrR family transcriptional regulator [Rhodospirillaceae bacterium]